MLNGFHQKITLPVLQNLIAAVVGAVLLALSQCAPTTFSGCSKDAVELTVEAEALLADDRLDDAARHLSDASALSPNCECVNALRASFEQRAMRQAKADGAAPLAEEHRAACYAYARKARTVLGYSARAQGLSRACSASGGLEAERAIGPTARPG